MKIHPAFPFLVSTILVREIYIRQLAIMLTWNVWRRERSLRCPSTCPHVKAKAEREGSALRPADVAAMGSWAELEFCPSLSFCVIAFQVICVAVPGIGPLLTAAGPSVRYGALQIKTNVTHFKISFNRSDSFWKKLPCTAYKWDKLVCVVWPPNRRPTAAKPMEIEPVAWSERKILMLSWDQMKALTLWIFDLSSLFDF